MTEHLWLVYAVLSAVMAALVSIFGKIGLQGLDADTATVIRAVIMALFLIAVMAACISCGVKVRCSCFALRMAGMRSAIISF